MTQAPFFFLKTALTIQDLLYFHMNCEIFCSSSVENAIGNIIGIALSLQMAFGNLVIFTIQQRLITLKAGSLRRSTKLTNHQPDSSRKKRKIKSTKSEREIKESIPFTIGTKRIKYLGVNLPKEIKKLYTENYKTQMKETKDDINRWRDSPRSWVGRVNIVKMTILPDAIYRFNTIPIK